MKVLILQLSSYSILSTWKFLKKSWKSSSHIKDQSLKSTQIFYGVEPTFPYKIQVELRKILEINLISCTGRSQTFQFHSSFLQITKMKCFRYDCINNISMEHILIDNANIIYTWRRRMDRRNQNRIIFIQILI